MKTVVQNILRETAAMAIRFSGLPALSRRTCAHNKATIVYYHDPAPEVFERHLQYFSRHYQFISLGMLVEALHARDWSQIPPRSLVVTFDDGHAGNYRLLPLFRKYGVRPVIYLVSSVVGTGRRYWFQEAGDDAEMLKRLPPDRREAILRQRCGYEPTREYTNGPRQALSAMELRELAPYVDFGAHTQFHPVLTTCCDEHCRREIQQSREEVEALTGQTCQHFSYPNGDYLQRERQYVAQAGYTSARTVDVGYSGVDADQYRLRAHYVGDDASINLLAAQLTGVPTYLRYRRQGGRGGRKPVIPAQRRAPERMSTTSGAEMTPRNRDWIAAGAIGECFNHRGN